MLEAAAAKLSALPDEGLERATQLLMQICENVYFHPEIARYRVVKPKTEVRQDRVVFTAHTLFSPPVSPFPDTVVGMRPAAVCWN